MALGRPRKKRKKVACPLSGCFASGWLCWSSVTFSVRCFVALRWVSTHRFSWFWYYLILFYIKYTKGYKHDSCTSWGYFTLFLFFLTLLSWDYPGIILVIRTARRWGEGGGSRSAPIVGEQDWQDAGAGGAGGREAAGGRWARDWELGPELYQGYALSHCENKAAPTVLGSNPAGGAFQHRSTSQMVNITPSPLRFFLKLGLYGCHMP